MPNNIDFWDASKELPMPYAPTYTGGLLAGILGDQERGGSVFDPGRKDYMSGYDAGTQAKLAAEGLLALSPFAQPVGKAMAPALAETLVTGAEKLGVPLRQNIFIGAESSLWDKPRAFEASKMLAKGVDPEEVWRKTGTFRSPDGMLRQEIDDSMSKFINLYGISQKAEALNARNQQIADILAQSKVQKDLFPKELKGAQKVLRDEVKANKAQLADPHGITAQQHRGNYAPLALEHDVLYEAYPELKNVIIRQGEKGSPGLLGSYMDKDLRVTAEGMAKDPRSTAIHEMQHAVQDIEGFGRGGSSTFAFNDPETKKIYERMKKEALVPNSFEDFKKGYGEAANNKEVLDAYNKYVEKVKSGKIAKLFDIEIQKAAAKEYYKRLAGEAESRAVQERINMTPEQRAKTYPLSNYDINPADAIVRNKGIFYNSLLGSIGK